MTLTLRSITRLSGALALTLLAGNAFAITYEPDGALERQSFESVSIQSATPIQDPADDYVIFEREMTRTAPPHIADMRTVTMTPGTDGWNVKIDIHGTLPDDPGMPVNFHVYVDRPDLPNSPLGVYRTGTDLAFLMLFGTRTKWHVDTWEYDAPTKNWEQLAAIVPFKTSASRFEMTIPYTTLPRDTGAQVRFLSLVSNNAGITMVDLAPGEGIPPVLEDQPTLPTDSEQPAPQNTVPVAAGTVNLSGILTIVVVMVLLFGCAFVWLKKR